ncbi:redoxin domain-containing protein [Maribacter sp. 2-571]|uniref:redoxin domain-containing protein n=1 Tax=Maribacter sp. 2-571 TaxID=3417569 RepID=UPI003D353DF2
MKKLAIFGGALLMLAACDSAPEGYTINGSIRGEVANGTAVYLKALGENSQPVDIDTATVENGKFVFTGKADVPEMHYLFFDKLGGNSALIIENGEIEWSGQKDSLNVAKIEGTEQNAIFSDYLDKFKGISGRAQSIQEDMQKANASRDEATLTALRDEMMELQEEYKNFDLNYIKEHRNALISTLLIERAMGSRALPSSDIQNMYDSLTPDMKNTKAAKRILEQLKVVREREENAKSTDIGATAPEFSAPTPDGKETSLSEVKGKLTLIDFWAAWCKPCRAENPNIVKVYEKYHDKGFNVLGVSLDRKAEDWKKAIADDGLVWNHVSNLAYFNDAIAKLYNVDAIPAAFLLDENGVIIAKGLRGKALEDKVAEVLN